MDNKRGQFQIIGLSIIAVVVLILSAVFFFSPKFRFMIMGIVLVVMGFVIFFKGNIKKKGLKIGLLLGFLVVGLAFILTSGALQSVLSVDQVNVGSDGKVYWLLSATADSIDEGYVFNYNPSTYTKSDGTKVDPQNSLRLSVSKVNSYCKYTLQSGNGYQILSNPDRVANIRVSDSKGNTLNMDATTIQSRQLADGLTIKTQGIISSKNDCPNYENVAILNGEIMDRASVERAIEECSGLFGTISCLAFGSSSKPNTQFISAFEQVPSVSSNEVRGNINIGNAIFTITANQDYFNSIVIIPPKDVDPRIDDIVVPSEIKVGGTSSVKVEISNKEDSEGTISVIATSDDLSISSSQKNVNLKDSVTVDFLVTANDNEGGSQICVEASGTNQFGGSNSDKECSSFTITKDQPKEFCGDGTCQSWESFTKCSDDCKKPEEEPNKTKEGDKCLWYQEPFTRTEKDYGVGYWRAILPFADPIETEVQDCRTAGWLNLTAIVLLVGGLGVFAIVMATKPKKRGGK